MAAIAAEIDLPPDEQIKNKTVVMSGTKDLSCEIKAELVAAKEMSATSAGENVAHLQVSPRRPDSALG